jgi:hypothetical protein
MDEIVSIARPESEQETQQRKPERPCTAEAAECTCPDFCERDHEND